MPRRPFWDTEVKPIRHSWRWPDRDALRGRVIDRETKRAVTAFMNVLANYCPYVVEEMRMRWAADYGDLAGALFYKGGVAQGVIADLMRDFPSEALVAAMELTRVSPWAALVMALLYARPNEASHTAP